MPQNECPVCCRRGGYLGHAEVTEEMAGRVGLNWSEVIDYVVDVRGWPRDFAERDLTQASSPRWAINLLASPTCCPLSVFAAIVERRSP